MYWILAIIAAFLLFGRNLLFGLVPSGLGGPSNGVNLGPSTVLQTPTGPVAEPINTTFVPAQPFNPQPFQVAGGIAQSATNTATSAAINAGSSFAKAIPIAGAVIGAIIGVFAQQSAKRAAEARDENSAVAAAVPQWDQWIQQIVQAYNAGQITDADCETGFQAAMNAYWQICQPHVQPGRDGCFPNGVFWTEAQAAQNKAGCSGNIGAACCVAYADFWPSIDNMRTAVRLNWNSGKPTPAQILQVFPSKYGGIARPAYTVTFARPV